MFVKRNLRRKAFAFLIDGDDQAGCSNRIAGTRYGFALHACSLRRLGLGQIRLLRLCGLAACGLCSMQSTAKDA
ncbi:MAG: hypothetical protein EBT99_03820 [Betaproteobacteria bacterium]|nr:hypothetical protein [Betaproteobacteria bacterium]